MDSLIFWVETPDLHADMADMITDWLDTSNFPPEHPLFSNENKHKLSFFKSETGAHFPHNSVRSDRKCIRSGHRRPTTPLIRSLRQKACRRVTWKNTRVTSNTYTSWRIGITPCANFEPSDRRIARSPREKWWRPVFPASTTSDIFFRTASLFVDLRTQRHSLVHFARGVRRPGEICKL